jgi:N-acetylneuraminic acid mutarotase
MSRWTRKAAVRGSSLALWLAGVVLGGISCRGNEIEAPTEPGGDLEAAAITSAVSNTWVTKRSLPQARLDHKAATLNNIIYAVGGRVGGVSTNTVVAYDLATNTWSSRQSLSSGREAMNGVSAIGQRLYVTGGARGNLGLTSTLFIYRPLTNTWVRKADMPETGACGAQGVIAGLLYLYSGCVADRLFRYDPATNTWITLAPPPTSHAHGSGGVIGGKFYLAGGSHAENGYYIAHAQLDIYDPATDTWTTGAPMPQRAELTASAVLNGKLYVAGGQIFQVESAALMVYSSVTKTWTTKAPIPATRTRAAGAAAGGRFYVIGGRENGLNVRKVVAYTP